MEQSKINSLKELENTLRNDKITMIVDEGFNVVNTFHKHISKLEGDIVECGVWRGGMSIYLSHLHSDKKIWVCDSYEGFEPLEKATVKYHKERHIPDYTITNHGSIIAPLEMVQNHFKLFELQNEIDKGRIKFLKGFVKDTLPTSGIEKIALLRVDVDAYSATLEVLEELYDKVQPGGYIVFDDSCLYEALDAIKYFFKEKNIPEFILHPVTNEKLNLYKTHTADDSGFPAGCYIIK
jgi:hypothetical protein